MGLKKYRIKIAEGDGGGEEEEERRMCERKRAMCKFIHGEEPDERQRLG